ncbi:MAG: Rap1a/Tai family immunity protein [Halioglobus sp.]
MRKLIFAVLLLLSVNTQALTGNQFVAFCEEGARDFLNTYCSGYITGLIDSHWAITQLQGKLYCAPEGVTHEQLKKVGLKHFDNHPETLHLPAAEALYFLAWKEAFPCE